FSAKRSTRSTPYDSLAAAVVQALQKSNRTWSCELPTGRVCTSGIMLGPLNFTNTTICTNAEPTSRSRNGCSQRPLDRALAGMTDMLRNLGGAVGTAILATILTKREQFHSDIIAIR